MEPITVARTNRRRRTTARLAGDRETQAIAAALGRAVRAWRRAHGVTLAQLAARIGIGRSRLAQLELGKGGTAPLGLWVATGQAIDRPLAVSFSRGVDDAPRDGGHLGIQELVLRLGRAHGRGRTFELPTRSLRSVDVGLRDDRERVLILGEIWNTITDVGAAKRDTDRKVDEVRQLAAIQPLPYRVASCWIVRATAANRTLLARYPSVFEAAFPGSSRGWVRALTDGTPPPEEPGLIWADVGATRLIEWRRR